MSRVARNEPAVCAAIALALVVLVAIGLTGCGSDDSGGDTTGEDAAGDTRWEPERATRPRATLDIPVYPFWPTDALVVDRERLTDLATEFCGRESNDVPAVDFFLGYLPMRALDESFCDAELCESEPHLWGDLYLSGYFGGIWLRELLGWNNRVDSVDSLRFAFDVLASTGTRTLDAVEFDGDDEILSAAERRLFPLVVLYGYNLGFLQRILEVPPPGIAPPVGLLNCEDDLIVDCDADDVGWDFVARYDESIDRLRFPPDDRWQQVRGSVDRASGFVDVGDFVWSGIRIDGLGEEAYAVLVDLSLNFLLAGKAAAMGHATSWADLNPAEGRFARKTDAGMIIWSGSYFMGLASPMDGFPSLTCP